MKHYQRSIDLPPSLALGYIKLEQSIIYAVVKAKELGLPQVTVNLSEYETEQYMSLLEFDLETFHELWVEPKIHASGDSSFTILTNLQ
jgi:hypothetical protein